jgi:hypothetical protein
MLLNVFNILIFFPVRRLAVVFPAAGNEPGGMSAVERTAKIDYIPAVFVPSGFGGQRCRKQTAAGPSPARIGP